MQNDPFWSSSPKLEAPATDGTAITPSDTEEIGFVTRAIYVGGGGNVRVVMRGGQTLTFSGVGQGTFLPIRALQVLATGTTATDLVGLY